MNIRIEYLIILVIAVFSSCKKESDKESRPNILLIVADDLGYSDLGSYGGEISTPNLDRLANQGVQFTSFYSTGRCCPSRATILTGQYPHRVGLGHMTSDRGLPGYRGSVQEEAVTIAELLKSSGYRTFISGKWHLGTDDPTKHGFEEFYGTLVSAKTFWDQDHFTRLPKDRKRIEYKEGEFYGTNSLTDYAINFLDLANKTPDQPWFLYLAHNAPHFPLHAPKEAINKYDSLYQVGWDQVREKRIDRMKSLGLIPENTLLTPRSEYWDWRVETPGVNPAWEDIPGDRKADLSRRMAIYAAMVDIMDQNIGRLVRYIEENNQLDNTLILFISDNGACAEWDPYGFDIKSSDQTILHEGEKLAEMGSPSTFHSVGSGWANASNTPWRMYKHYNHEGGISSPFIMHWPAGIDKTGLVRQKSHLIDIMPTILSATQTEYPHQLNGKTLLEAPGHNLLPIFQHNQLIERTLYFEHEGNRAIIDGEWKLTAIRNQQWELYNIEEDRTELNDLALQNPEMVDQLSTKWNQWAEANYVTPIPEDYGVGYFPQE